ncbi:hypothetical protein QCM77_02825 [Bradyrhizobium sp. SSUT18]|uniref:hypothetical protein n=1 Tax=unclassified Bradyrhizobium TaxID=2631580 RepID=UPI00244B94C1|nr:MULTISPECIES: hypothetical protein [unclassified Bradyrhizobium]MDH2344342.1 hypothetical protein [Bradyrhizobium sp. SSUT77]MDH2398925.1 hypothetical protein [Bradyrhizobium sp. SSUT18]
MLSSSGGLGRLLNFNDRMKTPSLGLVLGFWGISNVLVIAWWWADISDRFLPGALRYAGITFFVGASLAPLVLLFKVRRKFFNPVVLGLLVSCCLALSITAHEANLLRERLQFSLDHEREFAHVDAVEGVIRPLIARITEAYVQILGDDHTRGGSTFHTHIVVNYVFDSLSFLAVFALATLLLSPTATWLCLLTFAFYTQIAIYPGRMGPVFIAGGLFWQLFLLVSRRYPAAIISGLIISFGRTDVVFASAFVLLSLAAFERRWPTPKEWALFGLLVGISMAVPKMLIWMHPGTDFKSFLITHGDYFSKLVGNLLTMKLAVAIASPVLAIAVVRTFALTRTIAVVVPAALVHVGIVFLIADFSETRLIIPSLGALAFVASEALGKALEADDACRDETSA